MCKELRSHHSCPDKKKSQKKEILITFLVSIRELIVTGQKATLKFDEMENTGFPTWLLRVEAAGVANW